MKTQESLQTKIFMRKVFMTLLLLAVICWPSTLVLTFVAIIAQSGILGGLATATGLTAAISSVVVSIWYTEEGVPLNIPATQKRRNKEQNNDSEYLEWKRLKMEREEHEHIRQLVASGTEKIAYNGEMYYRKYDGTYEDYWGEKLKLPKELR